MANTETKATIEKANLLDLTGGNQRQGSPARWLLPLMIALVVLAVLIYGIRSRVKAAANLRTVTAEVAVPTVSVVPPKPTAPAQEIILPGNIQPFISSPIYARTDDFLSWRSWLDRKSTRLNSSHVKSSYAVFCLKKK